MFLALFILCVVIFGYLMYVLINKGGKTKCVKTYW